MFDHISSAIEQGATWPEDFPMPDIPMEAVDIWYWYWSIRQGISSGIGGTEPISHVEMVAWAQISRVNITPFMLRLFRILDTTFLESMNKAKK